MSTTHDPAPVMGRAEYLSRFSARGKLTLGSYRLLRASARLARKIAGLLDRGAGGRPDTDLFYPYAVPGFRYAFAVATEGEAQALERLLALTGATFRGDVFSDLSRDWSRHVMARPLGCLANEAVDVVTLLSKDGETMMMPTLIRCSERRPFSIWDVYNYRPRSLNRVVTERYRGFDVTFIASRDIPSPSHVSNFAFINAVKAHVVKPGMDVLDMFAGTGIVGLSLKTETEIASVSFAEANFLAVKHLRTTAERVAPGSKVWLSDLFDQIPPTEKYDLIVGNPPNGSRDDAVDFLTLQGDDLGWADHNRFMRQARDYLNPGGLVAMFEPMGSTVYDLVYRRADGYELAAIHPLPGNFGNLVILSRQ